MRADIASYAAQRAIPYLLHFTRSENLASILEHGLVPRASIDAGQFAGTVNDQARHDGRRGANCLSIAFPNFKMFFKYRMEDESIEWPVLAINPEILPTLDCLFCPTNAAASIVSSKTDAVLRDLNSFQSMYEDPQFGVRPQYLKECDPSDVQAEILVNGVIPPEAIFAIAFPSNPCLQKFTSLAGTREILVTDRRGLYGTRDYFRQWGYGK